jgi:hypothetical protein
MTYVYNKIENFIIKIHSIYSECYEYTVDHYKKQIIVDLSKEYFPIIGIMDTNPSFFIDIYDKNNEIVNENIIDFLALDHSFYVASENKYHNEQKQIVEYYISAHEDINKDVWCSLTLNNYTLEWTNTKETKANKFIIDYEVYYHY